MADISCPLITSAIGAFGDEVFEDAYDSFKRTITAGLAGSKLLGDIQVIYLQFLFGKVGPGTFNGISIGRYSHKNRSISLKIGIDLDHYDGLQAHECRALFMVQAIIGIRAAGARLQGAVSQNLDEIADALHVQIAKPAEQNSRMRTIASKIVVRDEPSQGDRSLLVLQFSERDLDYDGLIALERTLITALSGHAKVDGHDMGSGESNIFIFTENPRDTFDMAKKIIDSRGISDLKSGFRRLDDDDYTALWPANLREFNII